MNPEPKKFFPILLGCLLSAALLLVFGALRVNYPEFSSLEAHWVLLSLTPLFLALFFGGFISKLSAFGVEIDATLKAPISEKLLALESQNVSERLIAKEIRLTKGSYRFLADMPNVEKNNKKIIRLTLGTRYDEQLLTEYFRQLPNLEFIELINRDQQFIAMIPVSRLFTLYPEDQFGETPLSIFLTAVKSSGTRKMRWVFDANCAEKLTQNASIKQVLDVFRVKRARVVAIVGPGDSYAGVVTSENMIDLLSDLVLEELG